MFDFLGNFLKEKSFAFGVDLSDLSLKIVQLEKKKGKLGLVSFGKEMLPAGLVEGGEIKKEKELAKVIQKLVEKMRAEGLSGREAVCNLPEEKVFIRIVQLPRMQEKEVAQAIQFEAESHIPLDIEDTYLSWQIIKPMFNHIDHLDVLVAATPKSLVDGYVSVFKKSGLELVALEPESVAVVRSLMSPNDLKPTIIVDLGATGTNFVIYSAQAIRFTSKISISGQLFEKEISQKLKVDAKKASELKIKVGLDREKGEEVYQVLKPIINDLANQIKEYIAFYHQHATHIHGPDGHIGQVILCGGDALLNNLPPFLEERLNLSVKLGNPLKVFAGQLKGEEVFSQRHALTYTTALGLALRDFVSAS